MADRFPLVANSSTSQIQEIPHGDTLDLSGNNVKGVGIITATTFSGNVTGNADTATSATSATTATNAQGLTGTPNITVGTVTGTDATFSGNLTVQGTTTTIDTAVTSIDSLQIDGSVAIGTATGETNFLTTINGDLSLGEKNGTDNTYIDQKQNGSLELINSGRADNSGNIRINRFNNISGDTTYFRDFIVYDGKNTALLTVDGSAGTVSDSIGPLRRLGIQGASGGFSLAADMAGKLIRSTGNGSTLTIPQNVFSAGDMISVFNVSTGDNTIAQGTGATLYNTADGATGNRTLGPKGVCTIVCTSTNEFIISGSQLS